MGVLRGSNIRKEVKDAILWCKALLQLLTIVQKHSKEIFSVLQRRLEATNFNMYKKKQRKTIVYFHRLRRYAFWLLYRNLIRAPFTWNFTKSVPQRLNDFDQQKKVAIILQLSPIQKGLHHMLAHREHKQRIAPGWELSDWIYTLIWFDKIVQYTVYSISVFFVNEKIHLTWRTGLVFFCLFMILFVWTSDWRDRPL